MNPSKIDIFIAYAREDKIFLDELRKQLRILKRNGTVNKIWYDGEIIAGQTWEAEIKQELENADIFLLLLSPDFINSDYAYDIEMTKALERHRNGEATLIPIIARACAWHLTPLSELQAPVDGKPLGNLTPLQRDPLYSGIIDAVAKAAQQKRDEKDQTRRYFDDKKAWEKAVQLNTLKSYNNYLSQHPNGQHRSQAESAIAKIKAQQKTEREKIERQAWETVKQQKEYETYLKNYPNGQYAADARRIMAEREKQQAQAAKTADRKAFKAAKSQNSIAAYQQYIESFPYGKYASKANKTINKFSSNSKPFYPRAISVLLVCFMVSVFVIAIWKLRHPQVVDEKREQNLNLTLNEVDTILLDYEQFFFDKMLVAPDMTSSNRLFLDSVAMYLKNRAEFNLTITGLYRPSESKKTSGIFENLGVARANRIRTLLLRRGIEEERITLDYEQSKDENLVIPLFFDLFILEMPSEFDRTAFTFENMTFSDANFEYKSAEFTPGEPLKFYLDSVKTFLKRNPDKSITIIGHTDSIGSDAYNDTLGIRRAENALIYVRNLGITAEIDTETQGKRRPVAPNSKGERVDNPEGRQKNRRVNFIIQ